MRPLTIALECLFSTGLVIASVAIAFRLSERSLLHRIVDHLGVSRSDAIASDDRIHAIGVLVVVGLVVTAVVFIAWFRRAYKNTAAFSAPRRYSAGWAVGGWFVPFASFFIPKKIANDIWRGADPNGRTGSDGQVPAVLNAWWASWIALGLAARFGTMGGSSTSAHDALNRNLGSVVMFAAFVVASVLAAAVVRSVDRRQAARAASLRIADASR